MYVPTTSSPVDLQSYIEAIEHGIYEPQQCRSFTEVSHDPYLVAERSRSIERRGNLPARDALAHEQVALRQLSRTTVGRWGQLGFLSSCWVGKV